MSQQARVTTSQGARWLAFVALLCILFGAIATPTPTGDPSTAPGQPSTQGATTDVAEPPGQNPADVVLPGTGLGSAGRTARLALLLIVLGRALTAVRPTRWPGCSISAGSTIRTCAASGSTRTNRR
jgi:hypothetical protein